MLVANAEGEYTEHDCNLEAARHHIPYNVVVCDVAKLVANYTKDF